MGTSKGYFSKVETHLNVVEVICLNMIISKPNVNSSIWTCAPSVSIRIDKRLVGSI